MELNALVEQYRDEIIQTHQDLVRIPSVEGEAAPGMPFGEPCYRALAYVLNLARQMGFTRVKDVDGYAGYVEAGEGEQEIGVLVHLDVVPAGEGWTKPPFGAVIENGRIYGRGSEDNKCGAVAALYALRVLCDAHPTFQKRVRIIFGCNEETGMRCMEHYFQVEKMSDYGFAPDAVYPVINREKGILHMQFDKSCAPTVQPGIRVLEAHSGNRPNVVPAVATLKLSAENMEAIQAAAVDIEAQYQQPVAIERTEDVCNVTFHGVSTHASTPQHGVNAAGLLLIFLKRLPLADGEMEQALLQMANSIGLENDGRSLHIAGADQSGALTLNLGILQAEKGNVSFTIDIRYPVSYTLEQVERPVCETFVGNGFTQTICRNVPGHCVDDDHPLVRKLLRVYAEQTGNRPYTVPMGGGTYAKEMPNRAVAFGTAFPGKPVVAHSPDEYIEIEELLLNVKIFAHALHALACEPWETV